MLQCISISVITASEKQSGKTLEVLGKNLGIIVHVHENTGIHVE